MARNARAKQLREYGLSVLEGARSEQVLRMARQVNAASYTSAREYAGRSLFELLQNGYDAHPRDRRDGYCFRFAQKVDVEEFLAGVHAPRTALWASGWRCNGGLGYGNSRNT
ncbi:hypothetical protein [Streptomyces sp. NPDC048196]|uniref:hypothetical protein n=1 Tax=Streptomyces sp. NPDC048196 TaxID=3154712 RepID=UPI0033C88A76